jgi:DNA-directed RNA polymerase specialized sigma24 family protein
MRGVVRNVVFQQHRETRPDLHVHVDTQDGAFESSILNVADPGTSVEDRVINQSLLKESLRVLDELSDRDRECIMMYARGYTFVQIATALNISYDVAIRSTRKALLKTRRRIAR